MLRALLLCALILKGYVIVLPFPSFLLPPVLAELQQADLIASDECKGLSDINDVVRVQSAKSSEIMTKTAAVMRRHGLEEESKLLSGKCLALSAATRVCRWLCPMP